MQLLEIVLVLHLLSLLEAFLFEFLESISFEKTTFLIFKDELFPQNLAQLSLVFLF